MRKLLILVMSILFLFCLVSQSYSAYLFSGPLTEGLILSDSIGDGNVSINANLEFFQAQEIQTNSFLVPDSLPTWGSLKDGGVDYFHVMVIPFRFGYGVNDMVSVRATLPYVLISSSTDLSGTTSGNGLGDIRLEGLIDILKESSSSPGIAANLGIKLATGQKGDFGETEPTGNQATDIYLSGILKHKILKAETKFLFGYILKGEVADTEVDPADQWLASLCIGFPVRESLRLGGELWVLSTFGVDTISGNDIENSNFSSVFFSPFLSFMSGDDLSFNVSLDIPVSQAGTFSLADMGLHYFRGLNINFGVTMTM